MAVCGEFPSLPIHLLGMLQSLDHLRGHAVEDHPDPLKFPVVHRGQQRSSGSCHLLRLLCHGIFHIILYLVFVDLQFLTKLLLPLPIDAHADGVGHGSQAQQQGGRQCKGDDTFHFHVSVPFRRALRAHGIEAGGLGHKTVVYVLQHLQDLIPIHSRPSFSR